MRWGSGASRKTACGGVYEDAPPERGILFRLEVYQRAEIEGKQQLRSNLCLSNPRRRQWQSKDRNRGEGAGQAEKSVGFCRGSRVKCRGFKNFGDLFTIIN